MEIVWIYDYFKLPLNGLCRRINPEPCENLLGPDLTSNENPISVTENIVISVDCTDKGCSASTSKPPCPIKSELLWFSSLDESDSYTIHKLTEEELKDVETVRVGRFEALGTPYTYGDSYGQTKCDEKICITPDIRLMYETNIDPAEFATSENRIETISKAQFINLNSVKQIL